MDTNSGGVTEGGGADLVLQRCLWPGEGNKEAF